MVARVRAFFCDNPGITVGPAKPKPVDWNQMALDYFTSYGFTNPGRPPSGVNPSGNESIVMMADELEIRDQNRKLVKTVPLSRDSGPGGFGGSLFGGLLLLADPVSQCIANVSGWQSWVGGKK